MPQFATKDIRTLALVGHGAAGKTTLAEALLPRPARSRQPAASSAARPTSDFDPLEKAWQHSLRASVLHLETQGTRVHMIDTPGIPGFHRSGHRRARRGRDRGGRRQRIRRDRDDHFAHDGLGGEAQTLPPRRSSTRSTPRTSTLKDLLTRDPGHLRQGVPADQPAGRRRQAGRGLLLQSCRATRIFRRWPTRTARWSIRWSKSTRN